MVEVSVPGERWEIEFADNDVRIENSGVMKYLQ